MLSDLGPAAKPPIMDTQTLPTTSTTSPTTAPAESTQGRATSEAEQVAFMRALREQVVEKYRPMIASVPAPIRVMARMVNEAGNIARAEGIPQHIIDREIVNRTIGDVNVRLITENIDGVDYSTIGEDLGLILPGEHIGGRVSDGRVHIELNKREEEIELRLLRDYNWDMRIYDVYGVGNPLLREELAARFQKAWDIPTSADTLFISIGALDGLYKSIMALGGHFRHKYGANPAFGFPAPGFAVVNWQVEVAGVKLVIFQTEPENNFKLTYSETKRLLADEPDLRFLYLTVSNNPTAFGCSADDIRDIYRAIQEDGRDMVVLADLAYVGTGPVDEDEARMAAFHDPEILARTIFVSSLSKVFTLTGDRCGWVSMQNTEWADLLKVAWNNMTAGLPAEWQLRFAAYIEHFDEHPEIQEKISALYELRRENLKEKLYILNEKYDLFEEIGLDDHATIYNWSKLKPGEDALSVFEKTGIAGVPGSAFGYTDQYLRLSVGFTPVEQ